jgi:hypothetical protein
MGFGGTHTLHFDPADRGIHPFATRPRHQAPLTTVILLGRLDEPYASRPAVCLLLAASLGAMTDIHTRDNENPAIMLSKHRQG